MKAGDMVRYLDEEYLDIGVVMHIHDWQPADGGEIRQIDVLWNDGVGTHFTDEMEIFCEAG
jgi:hypothetical protein